MQRSRKCASCGSRSSREEQRGHHRVFIRCVFPFVSSRRIGNSLSSYTKRETKVIADVTAAFGYFSWRETASCGQRLTIHSRIRLLIITCRSLHLFENAKPWASVSRASWIPAPNVHSAATNEVRHVYLYKQAGKNDKIWNRTWMPQLRWRSYFSDRRLTRIVRHPNSDVTQG